MPIVAESFGYVMGVDTHAATHTYVVLAAATGAIVAGPRKFPTTTAGMARAITWCRRRTHQQPVLAAVEGTGCYGKRLTGLLAQEQVQVSEVRPPKKGGPKSDALDAEAAARTVLRAHLDRLTQPRTGRLRQALQVLTTARHAMNKQAVADTERLTALVRQLDLGVDARRRLSKSTITSIAMWRARGGDLIDVQVTRAEAVRLAQQVRATRKLLRANEKQLKALAAAAAPGLLDQPGVGPVTAAQVLVSWSHPDRFATEARFAMHAGIAPIPVGSGKTDGKRVRLNPGGDRALNCAIYYITRARMQFSPRTRDYVAKRAAHGDNTKIIARAVRRYVIRDIYRFLHTLPPLPETSGRPLPAPRPCPQTASRLAAGHPKGSALTPARTRPPSACGRLTP
jgi:Transposase IS116/IS110/IS902 family./Transposase.